MSLPSLHIKISLFTFIIAISLFSQVSAQSIFTSTFNITGGAKSLESGFFSKYSFEWSVGESTLVNTAVVSNLQVNHGLLQGYLLNVPFVPENGTWFPDEVKIYPNPVESFFTVDILSTAQGVVLFQLYNSSGVLHQTISMDYYGVGKTKVFNVTTLPSGLYFLKITLKNFPGPNFGSYIIRTGNFKIIKIK